jgi:hypothetical protein
VPVTPDPEIAELRAALAETRALLVEANRRRGASTRYAPAQSPPEPGRWDADIAALISTHSTGPARDGVQTVRVRPLVDALVGLPPVCPACGAACSGERSGA